MDHHLLVLLDLDAVDAAFTAFSETGIPMDAVSLLAHTDDERAPAAPGFGEAIERLRRHFGRLHGFAALWIEGAGSLVAFGSLAELVADGFASVFDDLDLCVHTSPALLGLVRIGVPLAHARLYEGRVRAGEILVLVEGSDDLVRRAALVLRRFAPREIDVRDDAMHEVHP